MKKAFILSLLAAFWGTSCSFAMSSGEGARQGLPVITENSNSYQIRVLGGVWLGFQGSAAYYDENNEAKIQRFFGNTPFIYNIKSKKGIKLYVTVVNAAPPGPFGGGGIFRVLLFKGNDFAGQRQAFMSRGEITLTYGVYPNINLEYMFPPPANQ